jgi:hypothetical protein
LTDQAKCVSQSASLTRALCRTFYAREIAAELERAGYFNERGGRYSAASVQHMIGQKISHSA